MATSLRRLRLPINYKIAGIKSSCGKSSLNRTDDNLPKRMTSSSCKIVQIGIAREVESGTSLLKHQPVDCIFRSHCICSRSTSLAEQQKCWSSDDDNNDSCCCLNYEERQKSLLPVIWFQPFNQNSCWPLPVLHLPYTYDSLSLPIKTYQGLDDMHVEDSGSVVPVEISTHNTQFPVFSGYLESSPYYMYCNGVSEHPLLTLSDFEHNFVSTAYVANKKTHNESPGKPSEEQLKNVYLKLSANLPTFFVDPLDYSFYHRDVVFQNNIRGVTTIGLGNYVQQMALIRILGHLRYAHIKFDVLKITYHTEDGTVRVRWRITGVSGFRALFFFWKFKLWEWKKMMAKETEWIDGFSVFFVGSDGLVYKHICDKMMPDEEKIRAKGSDVAVKFALVLGLLPRPYEYGSDMLSSNSFVQQELPCNQS